MFLLRATVWLPFASGLCQCYLRLSEFSADYSLLPQSRGNNMRQKGISNLQMVVFPCNKLRTCPWCNMWRQQYEGCIFLLHDWKPLIPSEQQNGEYSKKIHQLSLYRKHGLNILSMHKILTKNGCYYWFSQPFSKTRYVPVTTPAAVPGAPPSGGNTEPLKMKWCLLLFWSALAVHNRL